MLATKYILEFFKTKKINTFYVFQGGAIMNLINEIGKDRKGKFIIPHHEQSLSMQVDTSSRLNGYSVGMVTSGPGATNILTGVCSAFYDSVPCFFITGQVGQIHLKKNKNYRQFGFQETDIVSIYESVTKYVYQIKKVDELPYQLEKAYKISINGRPGPVILDIPFNIQKQNINLKKIKKTNQRKIINKNEIKKIKILNSYLLNARKPFFIVGGGIKRSNCEKKILKLIQKLKIPFATTWTSHDLAPYNYKYNMGSIGKNGSRSANYVAKEADLIITFGQRFAVKNIFGEFGKKAKIISIDIDRLELKTPLVKVDLGINLDLNIFFKNFKVPSVNKKYLDWVREASLLKKRLYEIVVFPKNKSHRKLINPFIFFNKISKSVSKNTIIHVDIGAHQTWFFQSFLHKEKQKIINHCGHGAMGSAICSSIAGYYSVKNMKNIVFIGDGGFMMNVQELNYIKSKKLPIKIVVLNNFSLGNTFLGTRLAFNKTYASDKQHGYTPPNIKNISEGFEIKCFSLKNNNNILNIFRKFINYSGPSVLDVNISKHQNTAELHLIKKNNRVIYD